MGLQIGDLVTRKRLDFNDLQGKVIAIDAFNTIYQFLTSVMQPDGTPLMDSKGNITSHLSGIFYRNISLLSEGVKLVYVFDGDYHELKSKTREIRKDAKVKAQEKYEDAKIRGDFEAMGKYSRGFVRITPEIIKESKELLEAMGIAVVQAPGEGEMQAAQLVREGSAYAVGSQDYDALVVGATRLIQNLTLARKRKTASGFVYIEPEMIEYERVLNDLYVTREQLICLAILVGTDFNPGGVRGIGPKKALELVRRKKYPVAIFEDVESKLDFNWEEIYEIFNKPNVIRGLDISFPKIDESKIKEILVKRHDFSLDRVEKQLAKLKEGKGKAAQKKLF